MEHMMEASSGAAGGSAAAAAGDIAIDDVADVMKVLSEIASNDVRNSDEERYVDRAALADEKLAILTARQAELEKR